MLNTLQVQKVLGLSMETIYRYIRRGEIKASQPFGRRGGWRVEPGALADFMRAKGLPVEVEELNRLASENASTKIGRR